MALRVSTASGTGETDPGFCTNARKNLMLAGMVGFLSVAVWLKTIGRAIKMVQGG
jgi:hypothetical protein